MRVFQFMPAHYGLDNIHKKRLKVAFIDDLNDPFELFALKTKTSSQRNAVASWRSHMAQVSRLLCFSKSWHNPVMWSHYGDKHKGLALGFDIPDEHLLNVNYQVSRLEADLERSVTTEVFTPEFSKELLTTKFQDWSYEDEVRMFVKPEETYKELGLEFFPFGESLKLREVIIGPRNTVTVEEVQRAWGRSPSTLKVTRTSLAWRLFRVIDDDL